MIKRLRGVAAIGAVAGGVLVGPVLPGARAEAAPVTLNGCGPTSGATDTAALRITIDDAALAGGTMVPLHDRTGGVVFPAPTDSAMSSPMCGVQQLADGSYRYEWLYCTDPVLNTCATEPLVRKGLAATGIGALSDLAKARLAWLLDTDVDNSTAATRVVSQRLVWCVTEGVAAGAPAPEYFKNGTDVAVSCPNWPAIDPTLDLQPTIAVTGPAGTVAVGGTARFEIATDTSPVSVATTGLAGLALCPGVTGATLVGGLLTIAAPDPAAPVALCATSAGGGTGTLTASIAARTGRTLEFWQRTANTEFCQGMLSAETLSTTDASASATVTFAALPTTTTLAPTTTTTLAATTTTTLAPTTTTTAGAGGGTTTTTVPDVPVSVQATTTTTDATSIIGGSSTTRPTVSESGITPRNVLPRTGADRSGTYVGWALLVTGLGVLLVSFARRPARR